jgi:hypothetical protein
LSFAVLKTGGKVTSFAGGFGREFQKVVVTAGKK